MKWLINFIFYIILSQNAQASLSCKYAKLLNDPAIANDPRVWEELGKLGKSDDKAIEKVLAKLHPRKVQRDASSTPNSQTATTAAKKSNVNINESNTAARDIKKLPKEITEHYEKFKKDFAEGGEAALAQKRSYSYEKIRENGIDARSIRLDRHYRVVFKIKDGEVQILGVGKNVYNH